LATLVTNKGRVAVTLPAPYSQTIAVGQTISLTDNVTVVYARTQAALPAALLATLVFTVDATSAPATTSTPTQTTTTGSTKITNVSASSAALPAPYYATVEASGYYVTTDSVAVVVGNLSSLSAAQQAIWSVSVASASSSASIITYGPLDLHGQRAIDAAAPVAASDLTTKAYVDAAVAGVTATAVTMGGDVTGQSSAATVGKLQGRPVATTAPAVDQVLGWNGATWTPVNQTGSGGGPTTVTLPTLATLNPGECVAIDPATGNAVRAKPTVPQQMPAVGVVQSATPETVVVQLTGPIGGFRGLVPGTVYFVSRSGAPDDSLPGPGAQIQIIGVAASATTLLVNPSFPTVQRSA